MRDYDDHDTLYQNCEIHGKCGYISKTVLNLRKKISLSKIVKDK